MTVWSRSRTVPKDENKHNKDWTKMQRHCWHQLKEEMGRHQCKNSFNNLKSNIVTQESSGYTTGRLDHPNPEEKENDFKCNFMKMMETFKEEVKISLIKATEKNIKKIGRI